MDILHEVLPENWLVWVTLLVTICSAISMVLPAPSETSNTAYKAVYRVIQWIALNIGKAKNADDKQTSGTSGETDNNAKR